MNNIQRRRRWYRTIGRLTASLLLAACLLAPALSAHAATTDEPSTVSYETRASLPVIYNGKTLAVTARHIAGTTFVPLGAFTKQFTTATYRYDNASGYAYLTAPNLTVSAGRGGSFITANDRPLWGGSTNRMIDGVMYVPLKPLAKALGLTFTESTWSVRISGSYRALQPASKVYREDEVYWLSRIISAESRGEPLTGQLAVGTVILNRTRTAGFPNTIWGVIFQKDQFSPVKNGSVYQSPAWSSVIAAKMCLEGDTIDDRILFFCNTAVSPSNWITKNRPPAFKIGAHTFFY